MKKKISKRARARQDARTHAHLTNALGQQTWENWLLRENSQTRLRVLCPSG